MLPANESTDARELAGFCVAIGTDVRLVQGAGGNVSVKAGSTLRIKASGTRLADAATSEIMVDLDREAAREAVLQTELLTPFILAGSPAGLRPSIETALHVLLPHKFVAHVHAVGTIAAGVGQNPLNSLSAIAADANLRLVPYAKPGIELARAVLSAVSDLESDETPLVLVLANHGLVVSANSIATVASLIARVESALVGAPSPVPGSGAAAREGYANLAVPGTLSAAQGDVLDGRSPLTPDSAVFLGARPFARDVASSTACVLEADGGVSIRDDLGPDEREIALSIVDVARLVKTGEAVSSIGDDGIAALLNWDAEKWRQAMRR